MARQINGAGHSFRYEEVTIPYLKPARKARYTPDFILSNGIIVETKGRFLTADRQKMLLVKDQYPDLEVRFVFSNSNTKISKASKTTYGVWCESKGFKYADKLIPPEWFDEQLDEAQLAALRDLQQG